MRFGATARIAVACLFLALAGSARGAGPNVVLVLTDDQRWDTLSAMPTVTSELVGRGVTFTNAFVVNPLCCPSRASLLTGRYSHSTRVYLNKGPRGLAAFDESSTLATWLRAAGYRTGFVGKYLNGYLGDYKPPGWHRWVAFAGSDRIGRPPGYYDYDLRVNSSLVSYGSQPSDYSTDVLATEAVSFVRSTREPFFLLFSTIAPHLPATPAPRHMGAFPNPEPWRPPSFNEPDVSDKPAWLQRVASLDDEAVRRLDEGRANQLRSLLAVDDAIGALLEALAEAGRLDNTIVVLTSDNGHFWGEHRLRAKMAPYEEAIRVPLVVRYDALTNTPRVEPRMVANIDLAPTLAELAGAGRPWVDGRTLVPLLGAETGRWDRRLLIEHLRISAANVVPSYCAVRSRRWAYIAYGTPDEELYDLDLDPGQLENRAADPALRPTLVALRRRLLGLCDPPPPRLNLTWICTKAGTSGADDLLGTPVLDALCGRAGNDRLLGRKGPDRLMGGMGRDGMRGELGDDRLFARDGYRDTLSCGAGTDLAVADRMDVVAADCETVRRG